MLNLLKFLVALALLVSLSGTNNLTLAENNTDATNLDLVKQYIFRDPNRLDVGARRWEEPIKVWLYFDKKDEKARKYALEALRMFKIISLSTNDRVRFDVSKNSNFRIFVGQNFLGENLRHYEALLSPWPRMTRDLIEKGFELRKNGQTCAQYISPLRYGQNIKYAIILADIYKYESKFDHCWVYTLVRNLGLDGFSTQDLERGKRDPVPSDAAYPLDYAVNALKVLYSDRARSGMTPDEIDNLQ